MNISVGAAHHTEVCVIGAGVIGLATARVLSMLGKEVLILEREPEIGLGISSRNSEVIHAGIYNPPGTFKSTLCVPGREMLYRYCDERRIPYDKKGKVIVATSDFQLHNDIPRLLRQARKNGVNDLTQLSSEDVTSNFEPEVTCCGAIFSPSSGIIDSHSLMLSFLADAEDHGATLASNSTVVGASVAKAGGIIIKAEGLDIICDTVINCAGLHSSNISSLIMNSETNHGEEPSSDSSHVMETKPHRHYYAKGNYFRLEGKSPFQHLVYPMPENGGLGVHATIDLDGQTRFGPDVEWIDSNVDNPDDIDLTVDRKRADHFYDEVRKYWPGLLDNALQPDYAGIRPKLRHHGQSDFVIEGSKQHGVKDYINLLGIESPGLTSCMSIADTIVRLLHEDSAI